MDKKNILIVGYALSNCSDEIHYCDALGEMGMEDRCINRGGSRKEVNKNGAF